MNKANPKYRPVLTATDILHILSLAKNDVPLQTESRVLIQKLSVFQTKIDNQSVAPAYTSKGTVTPEEKNTLLLASLGSDLVSDTDKETELNDMKDKEAYWEQCYKLLQTVGSSAMTLAQIDGAMEHRYLHDLMTADEEKAYESQLADRLDGEELT